MRGVLARGRGVAAALVTLIAAAAPAAAQEGGAPAESLFEDGRALLAQGRYAEACAKLTESERLDPAVGTLLNLGDCYEKLGKIATAWAVFKQAATMARAGKQLAREKIASARVLALEPKIPRLSIQVPAPPPGLEVRRDGLVLGAAEWAATDPSALAIDPGDHELVASAPGKKPWTTKITLAADGQTTRVVVPGLEVDELGERAPLQPARDVGVSLEAVTTHDRNVQRLLGVVVGAAGIASIIAAIPLGAHAITLNKDAASECPTNSTCTAEGQSDSQSAVTSGTIATVLLSAGVAVLGGGVVLYLTSPQASPSKRTGVTLSPRIGPGGAGLVGSF
jgi:hypothetical protein